MGARRRARAVLTQMHQRTNVSRPRPSHLGAGSVVPGIRGTTLRTERGPLPMPRCTPRTRVRLTVPSLSRSAAASRERQNLSRIFTPRPCTVDCRILRIHWTFQNLREAENIICGKTFFLKKCFPDDPDRRPRPWCPSPDTSARHKGGGRGWRHQTGGGLCLSSPSSRGLL